KRNRAVERLVAAASALDLDQRGVLKVRADLLVRFVPDHAAELQSLRGLLVRNVELERVEGLARDRAEVPRPERVFRLRRRSQSLETRADFSRQRRGRSGNR